MNNTFLPEEKGRKVYIYIYKYALTKCILRVIHVLLLSVNSDEVSSIVVIIIIKKSNTCA